MNWFVIMYFNSLLSIQLRKNNTYLHFMRKFFLFLSFAFTCSIAIASEHDGLGLVSIINSKELNNQNGSFTVDLKLNFSEEVILNQSIVASRLPEGFSIVPVAIGGNYSAGNSVHYSLTVNYDKTHLPFFRRK